MKKLLAILASVTVLLCSVGCQEKKTSDVSKDSSEVSIEKEDSVEKLKNHMTETELSRVKVRELTLLNDEEEEEEERHVQVFIGTKEDLRQNLEELKEYMSDEEYNDAIASCDQLDSDYRYIDTALVNGRHTMHFIPTSLDYDGGELKLCVSGEEHDEEVEFKNFDELKAYIKENLLANTFYGESARIKIYEDVIALWQSVIDGTYEEITKSEAEKAVAEYDNSIFHLYNESFNGDYKDKWEYNRSEIEEIKDSVREISIYDEELDTEFFVHVTLPPNFDEKKTYPAFVFSDGVWRFGNVPSIRKLMENGEIEDVILITLGYNYNFDGTSDQVRSYYMYENRDKYTDFIVDNLMPYLDEQYSIDYDKSGFYGHSAGGVLSHYGVFNSDKYENQPFKKYIIGSPALWNLHRINEDIEPDAVYTDYGFWDRNDKLDKEIFICAGENEDPEYEKYYDDYPTTLEGVELLKKRLEDHEAVCKCKIYENSGHWQFIPDMFMEFFRENYAK